MSKFIVYVFIISMLTSCVERDSFTLKDGFTVTRIYGDAHAIGTPEGRVLIFPNVVAADDDEEYIVGIREKANPEYKRPQGINNQPYGYFIYEKKTEGLTLGLSDKEYMRIIHEKGIELKVSK